MLSNLSKYLTFSAVLLLCLTSVGCSQERVPSGVMDEPTMAAFLKEAYLLEGFYAVETGFQYDTLHPEIVASYDTLLASFGITRADFEHSVEWYIRHPELYERVHDSVLARLDRDLAAENSPEPTSDSEDDSESTSTHVSSSKPTAIAIEY